MGERLGTLLANRVGGQIEVGEGGEGGGEGPGALFGEAAFDEAQLGQGRQLGMPGKLGDAIAGERVAAEVEVGKVLKGWELGHRSGVEEAAREVELGQGGGKGAKGADPFGANGVAREGESGEGPGVEGSDGAGFEVVLGQMEGGGAKMGGASEGEHAGVADPGSGQFEVGEVLEGAVVSEKRGGLRGEGAVAEGEAGEATAVEGAQKGVEGGLGEVDGEQGEGGEVGQGAVLDEEFEKVRFEEVTGA